MTLAMGSAIGLSMAYLVMLVLFVRKIIAGRIVLGRWLIERRRRPFSYFGLIVTELLFLCFFGFGLCQEFEALA